MNDMQLNLPEQHRHLIDLSEKGLPIAVNRGLPPPHPEPVLATHPSDALRASMEAAQLKGEPWHVAGKNVTFGDMTPQQRQAALGHWVDWKGITPMSREAIVNNHVESFSKAMEQRQDYQPPQPAQGERQGLTQ